MKIKLNLFQNAMHSLYHSLEHVGAAEHEYNKDRSFDHDEHLISWKHKDGGESFYVGKDYTKPPSNYNYKYAILHSIQALELLLKHFISQRSPDAIFTSEKRDKTISLAKALEEALKIDSTLFTHSQRALILQAKNIRNTIEHYEFHCSTYSARAMVADFITVIADLAYRVFEIKLIEYFSFDQWRDDEDPIKDIIGDLLQEASRRRSESFKRLVDEFRKRKPKEELLYCLSCFAKSVSRSSETCGICGEDAALDIEIIELVGDPFDSDDESIHPGRDELK
jgi:hypothetical protein